MLHSPLVLFSLDYVSGKSEILGKVKLTISCDSIVYVLELMYMDQFAGNLFSRNVRVK